MVIVFRYDYDRLVAFLKGAVSEATGDTWEEVASRLCRLGHWEFEDYTG